jgi:hypothetical protein
VNANVRACCDEQGDLLERQALGEIDGLHDCS